jgi:predicted hydrocarbon binding protein
MEDIKAAIQEAKEAVWNFHQEEFYRVPDRAEVLLGGVAHVLLPTSVLALAYRQDLEGALGTEVADLTLYRLGYLVGQAHARHFLERYPHRGLLFRILAGPFFFAWAGYGDVDLLEADIRTDPGFRVLWETEDSFSAREALREGLKRRVCHLQAGYSAGWCTEASGIPLAAKELACRAEGVRACRFLIAPEGAFPEVLGEGKWYKERKAYTVIPARIAKSGP